jgi:ethanolamine utilization protein EutM
MANQAIGMIETKGLCALLEATDAPSRPPSGFTGWEKIGSGYVTAFFRGDVASVKAAVDAGAAAAGSVGQVMCVRYSAAPRRAERAREMAQ